MKIYIAGPMTGIPEFNFPAFMRAETMLQQHNWEVINPARKDIERGHDMTGLDGTVHPHGFNYQETLLADLHYVAECDAIFMLDDWDLSAGATAEHALAVALGKIVYHESNARTLFEANG